MSFETYEHSVESGEPYELYDFVRGVWHMYLTTRKTPLTVTGLQVYEPASITRSRIPHGEDIAKDAITITVPIDHELVSEFLHFAPEESVSVTVRKLHRSLAYASAVVCWKGRVVSIEPRGERAELSCESLYTATRRHGLRLRCELICQRILYGAACGANQPAQRVDDAVSAMPTTTALTMSAISGYDAGWFSGGILACGAGQRYILSHSGNALTISRPLDGLAAGMTVALYPGCDRTMATCKAKFNNLNNYLGFPWMPGKNPFTVSIK
ncbi:MAG: phage BR0599 family protein [Bacilli bacterium]|jgi:uncharacterized phage protein (TIGR02218 family)